MCLVVGGAHTDAAARNSHSSAPKGWRRLTKKFGLGSSRKKIITAQHFYVRVYVCVPYPSFSSGLLAPRQLYEPPQPPPAIARNITDPTLFFFLPPFSHMDISFVICHFSIYAFKMFGFFILISFVVVVYSIKKGPGATTVTAVIYCRPSGIAEDIVRATWRFFLIQFSPDPTSAGCCNSSRSLSLSTFLIHYRLNY